MDIYCLCMNFNFTIPQIYIRAEGKQGGQAATNKRVKTKKKTQNGESKKKKRRKIQEKMYRRGDQKKDSKYLFGVRPNCVAETVAKRAECKNTKKKNE